jgi:DnaK suppressor protein
MSNEHKARYSDEELSEFKTLIEQRMEKSREELEFTRGQIAELNETGFNQQGGDMYDDSSAHTDLEMMQRMAARQEKYLDDLQKALFRIQNKTYGVCTVTGELIPKERLRVVPHATKSVDGKNIANAHRVIPVDSDGNTDAYNAAARPPGKPIGDKVRLPINKRSANTGSEDWEPDNETIENTTYRRTKDEDEE